VEVIKQGSATAIYMLPNMFVVMALCVLVVYLGTLMDRRLLTIIFIVIVSVLAGLSYRKVMSLSKKS
jgi:ABC-2 type transport system permease protein